MGKLLERIFRRVLRDPAVVPNTNNRLRLYPRGNGRWVVEGRGIKQDGQVVHLRWGGRELATTLWQCLEHDAGVPGFQFVFQRDLLAPLLTGGLTIDCDSTTWTVSSSEIHQQEEGTTSVTSAQELKALLDQGYILGSDGGLQKPKNLDAEWIGKTLSHYERARRLFKELFGYDLYVVGGTLLGWARDRDIISFDKDFDTGYVTDLTEVGEIQAEFARIVKTLLKRGEQIQLVGYRGGDGVHFLRRHYFFWLLDEEHHIDVFPGMMIDGRYRRPTFVQTRLVRDDLFPLRKEQLRGSEILVPRDYEKKLSAVYGPSWLIPDPFWKKIVPPELKKFFRQMRLSEEDLSEIATLSPAQKEMIDTLLTQKRNRHQLKT